MRFGCWVLVLTLNVVVGVMRAIFSSGVVGVFTGLSLLEIVMVVPMMGVAVMRVLVMLGM